MSFLSRFFRERPHTRVGHDDNPLIWHSDGPRYRYTFQRHETGPVFELLYLKDQEESLSGEWALSVPAYRLRNEYMGMYWGDATRRAEVYISQSENLSHRLAKAAAEFPYGQLVRWTESDGRYRSGTVVSPSPTAVRDRVRDDYGLIHVDVHVPVGDSSHTYRRYITALERI